MSRKLSLLILAITLSLVGPCLHLSGPTAVQAASHGAPAPAKRALHRGARAPAVAHDTITETTPLSASTPQNTAALTGQTTLQLPPQVVSGGRLVIVVHTLPYARLTVTIAFPDGASRVLLRRAGPDGYAMLAPVISYQPQAAAETATVTVVAVRARGNLDDSVMGNVTIVQRIRLSGYLTAPVSVVAGGQLSVVVTANLPNVQVHLTLSYPDGQVEPSDGATDATDTFAPAPFTIPTSERTGYLVVRAVLRYNGAERTVARRVRLRAHL